MLLNYSAGFHGHEFSESKSQNHNFNLKNNSLVRTTLLSNFPSTHRKEVCEDREVNWKTDSPLTQQSPRVVETTVRFQEPTHNRKYELTDEKQLSTLDSENDNPLHNQISIRQKQVQLKSLAFHLAHPAPTLTQTQKFLQIRPKTILQLQLLSAKARPKPFIDVLPSSVFVPRLARNFPRLFKGKGELGVNDVIIVRSEDYDTKTESYFRNSETNNDRLVNRELIAVICQVPGVKGVYQGVAEIVLSDGSILKATPLPGGLYEIKFKDENRCEMTAHWWIKTYPRRKSIESPDYADVNADLVYAFSIIESDSRKHPVMAIISHKKLEILSSYRSFSSTDRHSSPPSIRNSPQNSRFTNEEVSQNKMKEVTERLQRLIQVTGIWVSLRQNWSPYFRYNDALALAVSSTNLQTKNRSRTNSLTIETSRPPSGIRTPSSTGSSSGGRTTLIGNTIRATIGRSKSVNRNSYTSEPYDTSEAAVSAGKAFVKRVAARRLSSTSTAYSRTEEEEKPKAIIGCEVVECPKTSPTSQPSAHSRHCLPEPSKLSANISLKMHRHSTSAYCPPSIYYDEFDKIYDINNDNSMTIHKYSYSNSRNHRRKIFSNLLRRMNLTSSRPEQV